MGVHFKSMFPERAEARSSIHSPELGAGKLEPGIGWQVCMSTFSVVVVFDHVFEPSVCVP
jgi:hypothetical protein